MHGVRLMSRRMAVPSMTMISTLIKGFGGLVMSALFLMAGTTDVHAKNYRSAAGTSQISSQRALVISAYRSPRNNQRPNRKSTLYVILHTTEGGLRGSLEKLSANGECHYVVAPDGKIYAIIDKTKVAYHCGVSMWNGRTNLDTVSIGIEVVGYHDKSQTDAQYRALKILLRELKASYRITDENILTHSMVAYGNPNRWQPRRHRGRKRCGMLMAGPAARAKMGIYKKPAYDPDLLAGRLVDADPELTRILYKRGGAVVAPVLIDPILPIKVATKIAPKITERHQPEIEIKPSSNVVGPGRSAWDIARDMYRSKTTLYTFPDGTRKTGAEIRNWKSMPAGTRIDVANGDENSADGLVTIGVDGSARELAGDDVTAGTTYYFIEGSKAKYRPGSSLSLADIDKLPAGTKMLVGYSKGGPISSKLPVFEICSVRWDNPDTYYLDKSGNLTPGDQIKEKNIPIGSTVFYPQ